MILTIFSSDLTSNLKSETYLLKISNLTSIYMLNFLNMFFEISKIIIDLAARRRRDDLTSSRSDLVDDALISLADSVDIDDVSWLFSIVCNDDKLSTLSNFDDSRRVEISKTCCRRCDSKKFLFNDSDDRSLSLTMTDSLYITYSNFDSERSLKLNVDDNIEIKDKNEEVSEICKLSLLLLDKKTTSSSISLISIFSLLLEIFVIVAIVNAAVDAIARSDFVNLQWELMSRRENEKFAPEPQNSRWLEACSRTSDLISAMSRASLERANQLIYRLLRFSLLSKLSKKTY